jgi:hypothetical protein
MKHLLFLEVKPPRWLGIVLELRSIGESWESLWRSASPLKEKKQASGAGKGVKRDLAWSWPCEQPKLPQRRRWNHGVCDSVLWLTNHCVIFHNLPSSLLSSSIVHPCYIYCDVLYCLVYIVYIYPWISLKVYCISVNKITFWWKFSLNLLIPVRLVWQTGQTDLVWLTILKSVKILFLPIHRPSRQLSMWHSIFWSLVMFNSLLTV